MIDPISDMIVRIKNAGETSKEFLVVSYSNLKYAIAELLEKKGFIKSIAKKGKKVAKFIEIELLYEDKMPKIHGMERVSKFSKRVYSKSKDIKSVMNGLGTLVLTTSKGILTDEDAKKEHIGGEALFKIW